MKCINKNDNNNNTNNLLLVHKTYCIQHTPIEVGGINRNFINLNIYVNKD